MPVQTTTHLNFRGEARSALELYRDVFGGDLTVVTYADMGNGDDPATADHVVWGQVESPDGFRVMAYDVYRHLEWHRGANPFFVSVRGSDTDELRRYWDGLSEGATITQPLAPSAWAPLYGMLTDRFGVTWVIDAPAPYAG